MPTRLKTRFERSYVPYQTPRRGVRLEECDFYHTMDVPGHGVQEGHWDLRGQEATYLGDFDLSGKRVLDVGAASGALSFFMESAGAEVVSFDADALTMRESFFMIPYFDFEKRFHSTREAWFKDLVDGHEKMKNGFWLMHEMLESKIQCVYGNIYDGFPGDERFDVVVMGNVLTHLSDPLRALYAFANIADEAVIIVETGEPRPDLEPCMWFSPNLENELNYMSWWNFSSNFFEKTLEVIGFGEFQTTGHQQRYLRPAQELTNYTVIGQRCHAMAADDREDPGTAGHASSAKQARLLPTPEDEKFLGEIYQELLGRPPGTTGVAYYREALRTLRRLMGES